LLRDLQYFAFSFVADEREEKGKKEKRKE